MRSLRLLWMALILVLVVPLYGQVSCNRSCPPSPNPCQVAAGRSIETGQCVYSDIDGASCDYQGAAGSCFDGQCLPADCAAVSAFGYCEQSDGGGTGICMDLQCVALEADDPCLQPGVGRINCCEDAGCSVASGAYCNYPMANGMACDPSGIVRAGPGAEGGICIGGTCVATSGSCADRSCPTYWDSQCQRGYCDPLTGECGVWWVDSTSECLADNSPGYCRGGQCTEVNDDPKLWTVPRYPMRQPFLRAPVLGLWRQAVLDDGAARRNSDLRRHTDHS